MKDVIVQIPERQKDSCWSWVVCICSFFVHFVAFGFHNSFGTYFVALLDKYGKSEAETAWVGSIAIGLTFLLGPLAIYVCSHCGCRIATCTGSLIVIISVFLASIINDMKWMYLAFSVLNGLGSSLLYFSSLVVLIEYFHKHLSLANGIVLSGSGIGTFCINLISQKIISNYGLSMTYKAIAGLYIICFFAGLTFAPTHDYSKDIVLDEKKGDLQGHESLTTRFKRCFKVGEPWRNKGFIAWIGAIAVVMFAYYIPSMYIISIAKGIGVPPAKGGLLVGFLAICQTVGKIVVGRAADHPSVNRLTILQMGLLVTAVISCLLPLATSYEALVAYSVVQGLCDGCFGVLIGLVTHDIVGKRLMADAFGCLYLVVAVPISIGAPVAGMIYDRLGNYNVVFFLSSGLVCIGICLMFAVPWLVPASLPEGVKEIELDDDYCESFDESEEDYDMSYVDEKKVANLFGRKKVHNLLLDRSSLRNSLLSTRASSFVLFSIVSDDQHRDISTYTSRQELSSMLSGANTPIRGTPGNRRRHLDFESRTSMYSLRQSSLSVVNSEHHGVQENGETEHSGTPFEMALDTVQEVTEVERKVSRDDRKTCTQKAKAPASVEIVIEDTDSISVAKETKNTSVAEETENSSVAEQTKNTSVAEEPENTSVAEETKNTSVAEDTTNNKDYIVDERKCLSSEIYEEEEEVKRTSSKSDSKNSLKSSGIQSSDGTIDSGFGGEAWRSSSDVDSSYTIGQFIDNDKLCADVIPRSYSWNDVSATTQHQLPPTSNSQEYIDYERVDFQKCSYAGTSASDLDWDYSHTDGQYIEETETQTVSEMKEQSRVERVDNNAIDERVPSINIYENEIHFPIIETVPHIQSLQNRKGLPNMESRPNMESLPNTGHCSNMGHISNMKNHPNMGSIPNKDVIPDVPSQHKQYIDDMYSLELDAALELVEEVEAEYLKCDHSGKYYELTENFRETVV